MARAEIIFWTSLSFLSGMFLFGISTPGFLLIVIALLCSSSLFLFKKSLFAFVVLLGFLCGAWYGSFSLERERSQEDIIFNERVRFSAEIVSEPITIEGGSASFLAELETPRAGKIKVISNGSFFYGDHIDVEGIITAHEKKFGDHLAAFPKILKVRSGSGKNFIRKELIAVKQKAISALTEHLPGDLGVFASGITLGNRSGFSKEFREKMKDSGTTHLVALSGYNVAILVTVIYATLLPYFSRKITFIATLFAILIFVVMVGGEPSIVRAAGMGFLALFARHIGRLYSFGHSIVFIALFMIVTSPSILFSLGFQLSFVSLLGIAFVAPKLEVLLSKLRQEKKEGSWLTKAASQSLGAQIVVLPILTTSLGSASFLSFIPNTLILPFVPITMFFGFVVAVLGLFSASLSFPIALFLKILLLYETGIINFFSKIPFQFLGFRFSAFLYAIYYLMIFFFLIKNNHLDNGSLRRKK
ncbi:MAG: ComEC/Rec2 family competence protein [Patescibacteria group bacterium]